jgi:hypothetical protein
LPPHFPLSIVITPRDQYALAQASVASVLAGLSPSVKVVFVAGRVSEEILSFLKKKSKKHKNFTYLHEDRHLSANEARNLGLRSLPTRSDVVFIEADVVARKGWLASLIRCSRDTGADMVAPLILEGNPGEKELPVHIAGANFIREKRKNGTEELTLEHLLSHENCDWKKLSRRRVDVIEFHCLLVRRKCLDRIALDEKFGNLSAHIDFCLQAEKLKANIFVEPKAQVVFANPALVPIRTRMDFELFIDKWCEKACQKFARTAAKKWEMNPKGSFLWNRRKWALWNKIIIFSNFGVLTSAELFLSKVTRIKACPEWIRELWEKYLVARILAGARWLAPAPTMEKAARS